MSAIRFPLFAGSLPGFFAVSHPALGAADSASLCADVPGPKAMLPSTTARWIELSAEQWQFLRGVYAMKPGPVCPTAITPCWRGCAPPASQRIGSETQLSRWSRHQRKMTIEWKNHEPA